MVLNIFLLVASYILGSIPFSIILGKITRGIDVRHHGSGNPGGTNSLRHLGTGIGVLVLILDGFKAGFIILLIQFNVIPTTPELLNPLAFGVVAALGHVYSIFIKFRGGKAVAATFGMMIAYNPIFAIIMFAVFFLTLKITKYVGLSSTVTVFSLIFITLIFGDYHAIPYAAFLFLLVLSRHRSNFKNMKDGTESKVTWI